MLEIKDLHKRYKDVYALQGLDIKVEPGELFGLVGANGAGKTTTLKILAGLVKPDSGSIRKNNELVFDNMKSWKAKIGYVPDDFGFYDHLKTYEYLEYYANLYHLTGRNAKLKINECLEMVNMSGMEEKYVEHLSRGARQKLCIARSLIHNPEILLLDEPMSALDVENRMDIKRLLMQLCVDGKTIVLSSHILNDLMSMCTSLAVIEDGKTRYQGSVSDILHRIGDAKPIIIEFLEKDEKSFELIKHNSNVKNVIIKDNEVTLKFDGNDEAVSKLLTDLVREGAKILSFKRANKDIEELFLKFK